MKKAQSEKLSMWLTAITLSVVGLLMIFIPDLVYSISLDIFILGCFINSAIQFWRASQRHSIQGYLLGLFSFVFGVVLVFYDFIPGWVIRTCFGFYCLAIFFILAIQIVINFSNRTRTRVGEFVFALLYLILCVAALVNGSFSTRDLFRAFGAYFCVLGLRYALDAVDLTSTTYRWKRSFYISLPTLIAAFLPDAMLEKLQLRNRDDLTYGKEEYTEETPLHVMVHVGPEGFQKIGHFSFSWKGIVYSYGNYDSTSSRLGGLLGDGVYFNVPASTYLDNITTVENNSVFEYSIKTTPSQERMIETQLEKLKNRSYRWYCALEKDLSMKKPASLEEDYPSRLHYRTGAKFYKLKSGKFRTYWAMGDNCALFTDEILGTVGADVLSARGILSPGAYFDYLQNELQKPLSPVVKCVIHPFHAPASTFEAEPSAKNVK